MSADFVVTATGARAAEWREVFGTASLPVKSKFPVWASAPGIERGQFYLLDLDALSAKQLGKLSLHMAAKFGLPIAEVRAILVESGMPLLAEGLSLTIFRPLRWLPDDEDFFDREPDPADDGDPYDDYPDDDEGRKRGNWIGGYADA